LFVANCHFFQSSTRRALVNSCWALYWNKRRFARNKSKASSRCFYPYTQWAQLAPSEK